MRNPFRSEVEAFHFLLLTVAAFAAIALASLLGGPWAGVPTLAAVTGAAAFFYLRRGPAERTVRTAPAHVGAADERRILVVANETLADVSLVEEIERAAAGYRKQVRVVCPALTSPVRRWVSDLDGARAQDHHLHSLRRALELARARRRDPGTRAPCPADHPHRDRH